MRLRIERVVVGTECVTVGTWDWRDAWMGELNEWMSEWVPEDGKNYAVFKLYARSNLYSHLPISI